MQQSAVGIARASDAKDSPNGFAVYRICCGELGNRLLGLLSSFLFALLTDRALLVDWGSIPDSPCPMWADPGPDVH